MFLDLDHQLLIYMRGKRSIGKNRVVNAIQIGFFLFGKRKKLVIFARTGSIANDISGSIMYTPLGIKNKVGINYKFKINV